jgi:hypothetical protein
VFKTDSELTITTIEPFVAEWSHVGSGTVAYYEVKILKAGKYERIEVALLGTEVTYYGVSGEIRVGNRVVCKGPRFGSFDVVGVGLLRNGKVFFTYNGLLASSFIECDALQEVKMQVGLGGDGCEVELMIQTFAFQSDKGKIGVMQKKSKEMAEDLMKNLVKIVRKRKENGFVECKERFRAMLKNLQRADLIKKLD